MKTFLLVLGLCLALASAQGSAQADLITNLPGLSFNTSFDMYAGYLNGGTVPQGTVNNIFYWLTEYQYQDSDDVPLMFWLNGGPLCSSLIGLIKEHGPFHASEDGTVLFENPYAYNKIGNIVYLESPSGVGFAYTDNMTNISWTDDTTSLANTWAVNSFFLKHTKYAKRKWFVTGESYGGKYVPTLSARIVDWIRAGNMTNPNFQGMAIGNGCMDEVLLFNANVNFYYYHGLFGQTTWNNIKLGCCGSATADTDSCDFYGAIKGGGTSSSTISEDMNTLCLTNMAKVLAIVDTIPDLYNIYQSCYSSTSSSQSKFLPKSKFKSLIEAATWNTTYPTFNYYSTDPYMGYPCWGGSGMDRYLRRQDVMDAIHIPQAWYNISGGQWSGCSSLPYFSNYADMTKQFSYLLQPFNAPGEITPRQARLMTYNGDVDTVCNFLGDAWFANQVAAQNNLTTLSDDRILWFFGNQIGGTVKSFTNFDQLTVNGAGHYVPIDRPGPEIQLLYNYIHSTGNYTLPAPIPGLPIM